MTRFILILTLFSTICRWAPAETKHAQLKWEELGSRISGRKIALVLPDSTRVEGKVITIESDGVRMKISKSSNRKVQPKGEHLIRRQSLSTLRVTEYRKLGRVLCTLGAVGIAGGIVAASSIDVYEGPLVVAVPVVIGVGMAGAAVGGYYTGKAIDKRVTDIRIVP